MVFRKKGMGLAKSPGHPPCPGKPPGGRGFGTEFDRLPGDIQGFADVRSAEAGEAGEGGGQSEADVGIAGGKFIQFPEDLEAFGGSFLIEENPSQAVQGGDVGRRQAQRTDIEAEGGGGIGGRGLAVELYGFGGKRSGGFRRRPGGHRREPAQQKSGGEKARAHAYSFRRTETVDGSA
mgnify:CR=1 FL=1